MIVRTIICLMVLAGIMISNQASAAVFHSNLITNGKFDDDFFGWTGSNVSTNNLDDQYALDGQFLTLGQISATQAVSQTVDVPAATGQAIFSFYYRLYTTDTTTADYLNITFTRSDTGDVVLSDTIHSGAGDTADWTKYSLDVSRLAGKTITVTVGLVNNSSLFTFADVDSIRLHANSYGELKGTVHGSQGNNLRNVQITIRKPNNSKIWTGTTNARGKFTATGLPGNTKKYRVVFKKNNVTVTKHVRLDWAEQTHKTFSLMEL